MKCSLAIAAFDESERASLYLYHVASPRGASLRAVVAPAVARVEVPTGMRLLRHRQYLNKVDAENAARRVQTEAAASFPARGSLVRSIVAAVDQSDPPGLLRAAG